MSRLESLVFLWRRRVYGGSCKTYPFRRFPSRLSCRFARQARHFVTFQVSKVVVWQVQCSFASFSQDELQFSWQGQHFGDLCRHFAWQAQHFSRVALHSHIDSTLHTHPFTLHTPRITFHTLHFTLHILHFTLYTPHFKLHTLNSTLYTPHFTLYTLHSSLRALHSTLHTLHSTLYTLHSALYTPPSILNN